MEVANLQQQLSSRGQELQQQVAHLQQELDLAQAEAKKLAAAQKALAAAEDRLAGAAPAAAGSGAGSGAGPGAKSYYEVRAEAAMLVEAIEDQAHAAVEEAGQRAEAAELAAARAEARANAAQQQLGALRTLREGQRPPRRLGARRGLAARLLQWTAPPPPPCPAPPLHRPMRPGPRQHAPPPRRLRSLPGLPGQGCCILRSAICIPALPAAGTCARHACTRVHARSPSTARP
jgi:hypothetical protein